MPNCYLPTRTPGLIETALEMLQTAQTNSGLDWELTSRVRKFLPTQREKSGLHSLQHGTKTETHALPPVGAQRQPLQIPVCSHPIALSRLIQNCTRGHLHNIRVQSKYRKVQHSLRHVAGTGGVGGAKGAVDRCVN